MTRKEALDLVHTYIKNENLCRHCLAAEAVMAALADRLGQERETWALAGLLHDLDVEMTRADLTVHGLETVRILDLYGVDAQVLEAIKMHNEEAHGEKRTTVFHHALAAGETVTGLIVATALVQPGKKLAGVRPESVVKRMKEKAFARSVNRDIIRECSELGMSLDEFVAVALGAMQDISDELGL